MDKEFMEFAKEITVYEKSLKRKGATGKFEEFNDAVQLMYDFAEKHGGILSRVEFSKTDGEITVEIDTLHITRSELEEFKNIVNMADIISITGWTDEVQFTVCFKNIFEAIPENIIDMEKSNVLQ